MLSFMRAHGRHGGTHTIAHTHKLKFIHSYTHPGTRLGRQLVLAPTNSEEFVVIATVKWDDFTVSRNVSWPPCRYGNITRRRKREIERKRASEPSLHSSRLLPGTMSLRCPHFLPKTNTHIVTSLSNVCINTHTHTHTHLEKAVKSPFPPRPSLWLRVHYFQLQRYRHWRNLNSLHSMSILVQQCCTSRQVQLVEWAHVLSGSVRTENREEGRSGEGDQRHSAPPSVSLRCGEMEQRGDYRNGRRYADQQLYITILYLAQSFHYSISTLLSIVISTVGKVREKRGDREIGGRATDTADGWKKTKKAPDRERRRVVMLCCHGDMAAGSVANWQLSRHSGSPWVTAVSQSRRVRGQIGRWSPWIREQSHHTGPRQNVSGLNSMF